MPSGSSLAGDLGALAPCGLVVLAPDQTILCANAYLADLCGRELGALIGVKLPALLSGPSRVLFQTSLAQELALGGRIDEMALDVLRPDGGRVAVMLNAAQSARPSEAAGTLRLAIWRAEKRRAYEAEVPKARLAAQEAVAVKADFLANVSHEIRTPLNGIVGVAGVLGATSLDERQREMVTMIQASGRTLERLISDLLEISRVQAGALSLEVQPFDLAAEITGLIEMARLRARQKGLSFAFNFDPALHGAFLGDAVRLKQIFGHLTSNALKFTKSGGVTVDVTSLPTGVRITVTDTGIGFDEAYAPELFAGFAQVERGPAREFGGTGLGLSICKALVELMGGTIAVRSQAGVGSAFTVDLPLARAPVAAAHAPSDLPADSGRLQVLYVEDNPLNQRLVQMILATYDIDLQLADDGAQGVEAWRGGDFDLVLMDLQMPVMDGLTAIREIRRRETDDLRPFRTPIVVVSANAMDHHRREALEAGADLHIPKPVTPESLLAALQTALGGEGEGRAAA